MKKLFISILICGLIFIFGCGNQNKSIVLLAKNAVLITNSRLVLEDKYSAKSIGWWTNTNDEIIWDFEVKSKNDYTINAVVSCDPEFPGSVVDIMINGEIHSFEVFDTGSWGEFKTVKVGTIKLKPGSYKCVVKAASVNERFVCNLQRIELVNE